MNAASPALTPPFVAPQSFTDADAALQQVQLIYRQAQEHLRTQFRQFVQDGSLPQPIRAFYPQVRIRTRQPTRLPRDGQGQAWGFVAHAGVFETTLTDPQLFASYYRTQFRHLLDNHQVALEISTSSQPMPLHFALDPSEQVEGSLDAAQRARMHTTFDWPDLASMDDAIANGTHVPRHGEALPLALFTAPRVDYSLQRLRHYSGTEPRHFQNFVLFTNYQFYIDEFIRLGHAAMQDDTSGYTAFVEPGNVITQHASLPTPDGFVQGSHPQRLPQMPAYHLVGPDHDGITMVNIGVGPSNAKTMSDHVAVLRPHAWLMLGHCAGLRNSQQLGDYVLAHGYVREDHVLDHDLPPWVPLPALAEIQQALQQAVAEVTALPEDGLKAILRTGTVATTDNRNWELEGHQAPVQRFSQSRASAIDRESATVAANGFRFRVPYGTLLCVSDKPLHGEIKLPGMANHFYRQRVDQHLRIGMRAVELLRSGATGQLHSRKLRSFQEVAFQ